MLTLLDVLPLLRAKKLSVKHLEKYALDLVLAQDDITARELVDEVEKHVPVQHATKTLPDNIGPDVMDALADLRALGVTVVTANHILHQVTNNRRAAGRPYSSLTSQGIARATAALGTKRVAGGMQVRIGGSLKRLWWLGEGLSVEDHFKLEQLWTKDSETLAKHFAQDTGNSAL